jgi:hypothetical protein
MAVVVGDRPSLTYTLRDPATGALTDGTVVCAVTRPDGTSPAAPAVVRDSLGQYHAVTTVDQAGLWRWTFTSSGAVVDTTDGALYVWPVGQALPWIPGLRQVARYVMSRTVPIDTTSDDPLGTFTAATVPDDTQVYEELAAAVGWVSLRVGTVDPSLYQQAGDVAALRAAGMVELSYPVRDADVNTAAELLRQAEAALKDLAAANSGVTGTEPGTGVLLPQWSFPDPVAWGDRLM